MAAIEATQPRKKIATYGKSSRKRLYGFDHPERAAPAPFVRKAAWLADPVTEKQVKAPSSKTKPKDVAHGLEGDRQDLPPVLSPNSSKLARPKEAASRVEPAPRGVASKPNTTFRAHEDDTLDAHVFDVPSSEDEPQARGPAPSRPPHHRRGPGRAAPGPSTVARTAVRSPPGDADRAQWSSPKKSPARKRKAATAAATAAPADDRLAAHGDLPRERHFALQSALEKRSIGSSRLGSAFREKGSPERPRKAPKTMHEMGSHGNGRSARIDPVARQPDQIKIVRGPASRAPATAGVASTTSPIKTKLSKSSGRLKATTSPIASRAPISPSQVNPPSILDRSPITATLAVNAGRSPVNEPRTPPWSASHVSSTATSSEAHTPLKNRTTPRQMNLWNELLDGNAPPESPSDLNVHILQISRDSGPSRESPDVSRSSRSHVDRHPPRRSVVRADRAPRKRLIDALEEGDHAQGDTKVAAREGTSDVDEDRPDASQHTDVQRSPPPTAESVSQGPVSSIISGSQLTSSQGPVASQPGGPRITYARDRTYLTEKATDEAAMLNTPLDTDLGLGSQGRRAVTSKTVARSFGLDEEEDGVDGRAKGGIRSIHELRQAGGNKRFLDESEALFEDIEARHGSALSRRRNGMIELGSKMVDKRFARQFLDRSLDHRLFRGLDRDHDSITGFALASIFAVLTHERVGPSISPHARDEGIVSLLTRLLDDARDLDEIAKDRRANVSKASRGVVHDFAETIRRSAIWTSPAPEEMTPRLMALRCLEILSRRSPEASDREEVLPNETVRRIVLILSSVGPDDDEAEAPASEGLGVELALSILESCTMRAGSTTTALICDGIGTSSISNILVSASGEEQGASTARHALALRLILNLTNNNASACNALASWGLVAALVHSVATGFSGLAASLDDTERLSSLDQLILALATMINLAEGSETARQYMWRAPDEHEPLLDDLLQPFLAGLERATQADSMEASHSNVAFGYLAVLLANLCLDGTIKDQVRGRLPGGTVRPLSDAAEEFLHYHQKVDEQLHASGGDSTGPDGFTARLQHVVNRLKQK